MVELKPGQIWAARCLSSYEPNLWFIYVLLSADTDKSLSLPEDKEDILWWTAAEFMKGVYGAPVHKFTEEEIRKLEYQGQLNDFLSPEKMVDLARRQIRKEEEKENKKCGNG